MKRRNNIHLATAIAAENDIYTRYTEPDIQAVIKQITVMVMFVTTMETLDTVENC